MSAPQVTTVPRLGPLTLPSGRSLPIEMWRRRHRGIVVLLALHGIGLTTFGLYVGASVLHSVFEGAIVAAAALVASLPVLGRRGQSIAAAFGLMSASAVLTHLSGGYIEAHFHFFVMLGIIFLYEDWLPYALAVFYVAVHHGIAGSIDPLSVYNHPSAIANPWQWASIHAIFILSLSAALIVAWNVIERARLSETRAISQAEELKRQLHTQEKMAALGSLVAGLAHEVRTPLTVVGTSASLLEIAAKREPETPLAARVLSQTGTIQANVERINSLVSQLRRFHALPADETAVSSLDAVVREAVHLFVSANRSRRNVVVELDPTPPCRLHAFGVQQVVLNLMGNAADATDPATGSIRVETRAEGASAVLVVADNGGGMSPETLHKAFDPLFTTKKDGMGLGLHIVKRIVEGHGGTITCGSEVGKGTRFEIRFPLLASDPPPATAPLAASAAASALDGA